MNGHLNKINGGGVMIRKLFVSIQILLIAVLIQGCGSNYAGTGLNSSTSSAPNNENVGNLHSENEPTSGTTDFLASRVGCLTNDCEMTPMLNIIEDTERGKVLLDELHDFYDLYLRRQPDANGLSFWAGHVFLGNISMRTAKNYIRNSDEALQLGPKPEYQHIPSPDSRHTTCPAERTWIGRELSSREGYVTRFTNIRGSSYPEKGRYKEDFGHYCAKQRIRCWAGQVRARTVNIVPMWRKL